MPQIEYTPGDWTVKPGAIWNEIDAGNHTLVAKVLQIDDAKLIAAAPKMYEALKHMDTYGDDDLEIARSVLAEVEGK